MKMIANTEQTAVTKPALDFSGSSCVTAEALCAFLLFVGGMGDERGGSDDEFSLIAAHNLTSEICDLSQPKSERDNGIMTSSWWKLNEISQQLTMICPFLTFSINAAWTATEWRTPIALELYFIFETWCAVGEAVACRHGRQSDKRERNVRNYENWQQIQCQILLDHCWVCNTWTREIDSMILKNGFSSCVINCLINDVSITDADLHRMFIWKQKSLKFMNSLLLFQLTVFDLRDVDGQEVVAENNVAIIVQRGTKGKRSDVRLVLQQNALPINVKWFR